MPRAGLQARSQIAQHTAIVRVNQRPRRGARLLNLPLARKLTAMGIAAAGPAMIIAAIAIMAYDVSSSRQRLLRDTGMLAEVLGANSTAALAFGDARTAQ